ncbi:MAG: molecular chaperone GrpE [Thermoleophilaceae bacterium]|nr:molecular chaperone GrpE [Thermoleophilaceae bacterium]
MTRPTPNEDAVVSELKAMDEKSSDNGGDTEVAAESAAPEQPEVDELTVATRERDEYLDLAKRTQADFENYRKRTAKDLQAAGARARIGLIREILPVVDNLERALGVAPAGDGDAFVEGVRLVYRELEGALARAGVEAIEPKGDAFDPNVHEALSMRPQEGAKSGTVLDVVEKGYRTADTVVRPARVVVAS